MWTGWASWIAVMQYVILWVTASTTYIMAVKRGDQPRWLPTISNTGNQRPQSGIFTLGMTLSAVLLLFNVIFKYAHVNTLLDKRDPEKQKLITGNVQDMPGSDRVAADRKWNLAALILGIITVFGIFVIASIQDNLCKFAWLSPRSVYLTAIRLSFLLLGLGTFFGMIAIIIVINTPHHADVFPIGALFEWLFVFCQQSNMLAWFFMDFRQLKVRVHADDE